MIPLARAAAYLRGGLLWIWSAWLWTLIVLAVTVWTPLVFFSWLTERDRLRRRTGRLFRNLGIVVTRFSPGWRVCVEGSECLPSGPFLVVCNHQSSADIPVLCYLPGEMKWIAKHSLFRIPGFGWMMRMAGDIPVDRSSRLGGAKTLLRAAHYLQSGMSVLVFPEGTRSRDGQVKPFHEAPFRLAIKHGVPVLPVALQGTRDCLVRGSWRFSARARIVVSICPPLPTAGLEEEAAPQLRDQARAMIIARVAGSKAEQPAAR